MPAWVLVADASRARIFSAEKAASPLQEINTLAFPEARLHEGDLTTDKGGRSLDPGLGGHGVNGEAPHKHENAERFAALICDTLEAARLKGEFAKLYIVAAPTFLGLLRKHLNQSLRALVAGELDKNLATHAAESIRKSLPDFL